VVYLVGVLAALHFLWLAKQGRTAAVRVCRDPGASSWEFDCGERSVWQGVPEIGRPEVEGGREVKRMRRAEMTSRERVLASLNHQEPDCVPIALGQAVGDGITLVAYRNLLRHLGMGRGDGPTEGHHARRRPRWTRRCCGASGWTSGGSGWERRTAGGPVARRPYRPG